MSAQAWRGATARARASLAADVLMFLRAAPETILTGGLRRTARQRPQLFERLGATQDAAFVIAPTDFPVAFRLQPSGRRGEIRVVRHEDAGPCAARVSGPIRLLLALMDGSSDADATFFSRQVRIEGDTGAVVALHNTLEAAELDLTDLLGVKPPLRGAVRAVLAAGLSRLHKINGAG